MKRQLTSDEVINEIAEVLREGDGEFIAKIANMVLVPEVTYLEDSMFEQEIDNGEYIDIEDCIKQGTHLSDVDDDGFCNFCGHQECTDGKEDE